MNLKAGEIRVGRRREKGDLIEIQTWGSKMSGLKHSKESPSFGPNCEEGSRFRKLHRYDWGKRADGSDQGSVIRKKGVE